MDRYKRSVEIVGHDGHRRVYAASDEDEWRRRIVDYVFARVANDEVVSHSVLWMIGRRQYDLANETPVVKLVDANRHQSMPIIEWVETEDSKTIVLKG